MRHDDSELLIYAVKESRTEGGRQWRIHPRKKFLPEGYTEATKPQNPITLKLNQQKFLPDQMHME